MYLKQQRKPNGDIYLSVMEKYHVPRVGAREKTVLSIGYVSELKKEYDDPIAHFTAVAKKMTEEKKVLKNTSVVIDMTEKMEIGESDFKNVGYGILKELYFQLELDRFWRSKTRGRKIKYNLELIFRLLVISRILYPGSKNIYFINGDNKGAVNTRDGYVYGQSVRGASEEFKKWMNSMSSNASQNPEKHPYRAKS